MLCGSMVERVLISCIEVVNVTNIEMQDVFFYTYSWGTQCEGYKGESKESYILFVKKS